MAKVITQRAQHLINETAAARRMRNEVFNSRGYLSVAARQLNVRYCRFERDGLLFGLIFAIRRHFKSPLRFQQIIGDHVVPLVGSISAVGHIPADNHHHGGKRGT